MKCVVGNEASVFWVSEQLQNSLSHDVGSIVDQVRPEDARPQALCRVVYGPGKTADRMPTATQLAN